MRLRKYIVMNNKYDIQTRIRSQHILNYLRLSAIQVEQSNVCPYTFEKKWAYAHRIIDFLYLLCEVKAYTCRKRQIIHKNIL